MAGKKVVALTNIKHDGTEVAAGEEVDTGMFSKEQMQELVDSGAVEVQGSDTAPKATNEGEQQQKAGETPTPAATEQKTSSATSASPKSNK